VFQFNLYFFTLRAPFSLFFFFPPNSQQRKSATFLIGPLFLMVFQKSSSLHARRFFVSNQRPLAQRPTSHGAARAFFSLRESLHSQRFPAARDVLLDEPLSSQDIYLSSLLPFIMLNGLLICRISFLLPHSPARLFQACRTTLF